MEILENSKRQWKFLHVAGIRKHFFILLNFNLVSVTYCNINKESILHFLLTIVHFHLQFTCRMRTRPVDLIQKKYAKII